VSTVVGTSDLYGREAGRHARLCVHDSATQEVSDEQYDEQRRREGGGGRDRPGAT